MSLIVKQFFFSVRIIQGYLYTQHKWTKGYK